jgi:2,3-dihydroxybenzoate-AMP ligase
MPNRTAEPTQAGTVPWPQDEAACFVARGFWQGRPLGEHLYATAATRPDAVCIVDGAVQLTFRELTARADGAAMRLRELGLRRDDRVVLQLPNSWQFLVVTVACLRLGVVPALSVTAHRRHELAAVAAHADVRALIVPGVIRDFDHEEMAAEVAADAPGIEHILVLGSAVRPGHVSVDALCEPAGDPAAAAAVLDSDAPGGTDVALFFLSGGTTGRPKMIPRTHNDLAYMMERAADVSLIGPDAVYLAALPLGHGFPLTGPGALGVLIAGGRVVLVPSPVPERAFTEVERHRVTVTSLVPAVLQRWLEHRAESGADLSSLRLLQVGGSRLPDDVARRVKPVLGCTLQQVFGMSEGLLCLTRPDDPDDVLHHTQGRPVSPADELALVGEDGGPVADGEPGVLLTRGPYTPRGYYRGGALNDAAYLPGGWYRTGDIVRRRPDGNLIVEGRDKDVINRGGEKISAEEVESPAYRIDGVRMAAAVAMPDPALGERICLYVVAHPGREPALAELRAIMTDTGTAHYKLPERLVIVETLPMTAIGKVDKKALRQDIARRIAAEATP